MTLPWNALLAAVLTVAAGRVGNAWENIATLLPMTAGQ
jgi:hypothetical protein